MAGAVERPYEILDAAVRANGGERPLEQGEGDSMVAAFARASDAVTAALEAARNLGAERWATSAGTRGVTKAATCDLPSLAVHAYGVRLTCRVGSRAG